MPSSKVDREKNVDKSDLNKIFENLILLETAFIKEAKAYIELENQNGEKSIFAMDLFISAIVNRGISLMRGFRTLADSNNYISAVPLIRLQIDNCLRFYAATIVKNRDEFFDKYISGEHIGSMLDIDSKKMTDNYLAAKLDKEYFPGILNLYKNTSGYIHLSNEHSFIQNEIKEQAERTISTRIGLFDFFAIDQKVDFSFNMSMASQFLIKLVQSWKPEKKRILEAMANKGK